jgi:hypothetical protein
MLRHRPNQKTFFDEIIGYYLPDNHFLKVNDIINWTSIEKGLKALYDPSKGRPGYHPPSCLRPCFCNSGSPFLTLTYRKPSQKTFLIKIKSFLELSLSDPVPDDTIFGLPAL